MQKWLLNLIIVGASFIGIQMISGELEQKFYFEVIESPKSENQTKMENEQRLAEKTEVKSEAPIKEGETFKQDEKQADKVPEQTLSSAEESVQTGVKSQPKNDTMVSILNSMDLNGLQSLKGVGPVTAQRILDYKTSQGKFKSLDELMEVKGIGPKKLESIKASLQSMQK